MPRAKISHKMALFSLTRLYAELRGKIRFGDPRNKPEIEADIEHVRAVVAMLNPAFDLSTIKPVIRNVPNRWFRRGECFRAALDVLRRAEGPLTSKEIAIRVLHARGVTKPDRLAVSNMFGAVHTSLMRYRDRSVTMIEGRPKRWSLR
jgi:hypothetical protein